MNYKVVFERFAEEHFMKKFARTYKEAWEPTRDGLALQFSHVEKLFEREIAEKVLEVRDGEVSICKTEFRIGGTDMTRHGSGNRCIIAVNTKTATVHVLLVYAKSDIGGEPRETKKWQSLIRENYTEYKKFF